VGSSYNGATLQVYRKDAGGSWTEVTTCTVSQGLCSFTTTNLSSFAVTQAVASSSGGGGSDIITVIQGANGTIAPGSLDNVPQGAEETFTITPNSGYQVADVLIDGRSAGAITSYTFLNVVTGHTITASFSPIPVSIPSPSVVMNSGGGGGSAAPATTATAVPPPGATTSGAAASGTASALPSTASLITELASLQSQLAVLQALANQRAAASSPRFVFRRNLEPWDTGGDVQALQEFLVAQDSGPAAEKLKAHGTTMVFGRLTLNALIEFQKKVGITPASGYFGPKTRGYVNNLDQ
jgi:hypothetical protein